MAFFEWQYLIFELPIVAALLYVVLMASGLSLGEDAHLDVGHDVHVEADHHVHAEAHGHHLHILGAVLGFLGIGKVPLSILMMSACFIWGAAGLLLLVMLGVDSILKVVAFTALAAGVGTRLVAEGLSALIPREESYYTPKEHMVGQVGEVLYEVTRASGTVRLRDPSGNLLDLDCRTRGDECIKSGTRVVLHEYDRSADVFYVHA